ncbi:MAG TPA: oligosaccharide flippase family protein, partial [Alphaproteobacteria bacterium]|nr:oligosaccharide flippase family protein [Alphaproteobacteria bacterium]
MSVRRSTYFSFGSRQLGVLVNFAATVVIARLLTPAEIGVFAVSAAFVMISQVIRDSGIGSYLIQERNLSRERIRSAMGVSLVIGGLLGLMIVGLALPLAQFYGEPGVEDVMHILVFSFVLAPVNAVGLALLRRELAFGTTFWLETSSNAVWAATAITLAYLGASYYSMAWASVVSTSTLCLLFLVSRPDAILIRPSLKQWRLVFSFSSMVTLTQLITQVGVLAPALVLGRVADFGSVAFYNRGNSVTK